MLTPFGRAILRLHLKEFTMRGRTNEQPALYHTFDVEDRIRADHPLRDVKRRADRILSSCCESRRRNSLNQPAASVIGTTSLPDG